MGGPDQRSPAATDAKLAQVMHGLGHLRVHSSSSAPTSSVAGRSATLHSPNTRPTKLSTSAAFPARTRAQAGWRSRSCSISPYFMSREPASRPLPLRAPRRGRHQGNDRGGTVIRAPPRPPYPSSALLKSVAVHLPGGRGQPHRAHIGRARMRSPSS